MCNIIWPKKAIIVECRLRADERSKHIANQRAKEST